MCSGEMARLPSRCTGKPGGLKTPAPLHSCTYHVQFLSISYHGLHIRTNAVWKWEFNGYCNECWLNRSEKQEEGDAGERREVCLGCSGVVGFSRGQMIWWKRDYFFFFPVLSPPCTQGSRLVQEGRALPWYASLEGFLQATSRLFGCHRDCLKRICFCAILQGAPHQEKVDHPWALDTAFMHLSILRQIGWASLAPLLPSAWADLQPDIVIYRLTLFTLIMN